MNHSSYVYQAVFFMTLSCSFSRQFRLIRTTLSGGLTSSAKWLCLIHTLGFSQATFAEDIAIYVEGIEQPEGQVICSLFDSEESFLETPMQVSKTRLSGPSPYRATFSDLVPGEYAVICLHDANANNELDTNFIGIPEEAVGSSNNAFNRFGPPRYEDAAFLLPKGENTHTHQIHTLEIKVQHVF